MLAGFGLWVYRLIYENVIRAWLFRNTTATQGHVWALRLASVADRWPGPFVGVREALMPLEPTFIGGVALPHPLILAAGFVKGRGFEDEAAAVKAADKGAAIMPGWRGMAALVGAVEYGSFTPHPRMGNSGTVLWRDVPSRSLQNRVGLRNPGAQAAAIFLAKRRAAGQLPLVWGLNLATTPGLEDDALLVTQMRAAFLHFVQRDVIPSWFTLNLSCPNTEDDPQGSQTEARAAALCAALVPLLPAPLWVKLGPNLGENQYARLMRVFAETGVRAVIASNTLPAPAPDQMTAGLSGGRLLPYALRAARLLVEQRAKHGYAVDVIGCGGVQDGATYAAYRKIGISAVQYWSALVYRGPLAAAMIAYEGKTL
jgi:dihydroorotate dehydrogenase